MGSTFLGKTTQIVTYLLTYHNIINHYDNCNKTSFQENFLMVTCEYLSKKQKESIKLRIMQVGTYLNGNSRRASSFV